MTLEIAPEALAELKSVSEYTEHTWGSEQRELYLHQIFSKFEEIFAAPEQHRSRDDLFNRCRVCPIGKHLIFYEVIAESLFVVRVLHERMNVKSHFD